MCYAKRRTFKFKINYVLKAIAEYHRTRANQIEERKAAAEVERRKKETTLKRIGEVKRRREDDDRRAVENAKRRREKENVERRREGEERKADEEVKRRRAKEKRSAIEERRVSDELPAVPSHVYHQMWKSHTITRVTNLPSCRSTPGDIVILDSEGENKDESSVSKGGEVTKCPSGEEDVVDLSFSQGVDMTVERRTSPATLIDLRDTLYRKRSRVDYTPPSSGDVVDLSNDTPQRVRRRERLSSATMSSMSTISSPPWTT